MVCVCFVLDCVLMYYLRGSEYFYISDSFSGDHKKWVFPVNSERVQANRQYYSAGMTRNDRLLTFSALGAHQRRTSNQDVIDRFNFKNYLNPLRVECSGARTAMLGHRRIDLEYGTRILDWRRY